MHLFRDDVRSRAWLNPNALTSILLYRDLYRGIIVWNKTRKGNTWGLEKRSVKAAGDWITIDAPHLRIVTDAQWIAAHGRLEQSRQTYLRGRNCWTRRFSKRRRLERPRVSPRRRK